MGELLLCTEVFFFQMIIFFTLLWEGHDQNSRLQRLRWLSSACPRGSREPPDSNPTLAPEPECRKCEMLPV